VLALEASRVEVPWFLVKMAQDCVNKAAKSISVDAMNSVL
jgi:hypothetical protein